MIIDAIPFTSNDGVPTPFALVQAKGLTVKRFAHDNDLFCSMSELFSQRLQSQGVDALAFGMRFDRKFFIQLGRNAQVEFAREMAAWFDAFLFAYLKKSLQRPFELRAKLSGVFTVEICTTANPK